MTLLVFIICISSKFIIISIITYVALIKLICDTTKVVISFISPNSSRHSSWVIWINVSLSVSSFINIQFLLSVHHWLGIGFDLSFCSSSVSWICSGGSNSVRKCSELFVISHHVFSLIPLLGSFLFYNFSKV